MTQPKDQKCQERLLDWRIAFDATDQEKLELDDGNVRRSSEINLGEMSSPK